VKPLVTLLLIVSAGDYDRVNPIVSVAMREADLGPLARQAAGLALVEVGAKKPSRIPAQWDPETKQLVFILPGATRRGTTRTFKLIASTPAKSSVVATRADGPRLEVRRGGKPVLPRAISIRSGRPAARLSPATSTRITSTIAGCGSRG